MINKIFNLYKKHKEIINYLIVGVLTTLVSLVSYYLCVFTFLNPNVSWQLQLANIISWIAAVTFAYFTNRKFVFESKNKNKLKECFEFYFGRVFTLLLDMALMFLLVTVLKFNDKIIKLLIQVIVTVVNYIISKFLIFTNKRKED